MIRQRELCIWTYKGALFKHILSFTVEWSRGKEYHRGDAASKAARAARFGDGVWLVYGLCWNGKPNVLKTA